MVNSRAKGGRVERLVVDWLKSKGCASARRSVQYCGRGGESADVLCDELGDWHIEVKGTAGASVPRNVALRWAEQVKTDCPAGKKAVLIHVPNNHLWTAWQLAGPLNNAYKPCLSEDFGSFCPSKPLERQLLAFGDNETDVYFPLNALKDTKRWGWQAEQADNWYYYAISKRVIVLSPEPSQSVP